MSLDFVNPAALAKPSGFSHAAIGSGLYNQLFVATSHKFVLPRWRPQNRLFAHSQL